MPTIAFVLGQAPERTSPMATKRNSKGDAVIAGKEQAATTSGPVGQPRSLIAEAEAAMRRFLRRPLVRPDVRT